MSGSSGSPGTSGAPGSSGAPVSSVWPMLHYDDTRRALRFLVDAFGFEAAVAATDDDGDVVHAELRWPGGGALVFGSTKHVDSVHGHLPAGVNAVYVVVDDADAVEAVHRRAVDAGAGVAQAPHDATFGSGAASRAVTLRDPEGNLWTFGTYRGPG